MAYTIGPIQAWSRDDTTPTSSEGGYAGAASTAAAVGTSLDQSSRALGTVDNLVVTASTLDYGQEATATISGTSPWKTIHVGIPKGMPDSVGQQLTADAAASADAATLARDDADAAVLLAQQAQAAAYNVPDVAMRDIINNPATETVAALDRWIVTNARPIDPTSPVYGAAGDGSTDDTAAIQAAVNAGNVVLPRRSFRVTGPIDLPDGRGFTGAGARESIILNYTDTSTFTSTGGSVQSVRNLAIRSWFTGARTSYDIDIVNPTKVVLEDVEIDGASTATGTLGIRLRGDSQLPGNAFMPQLSRVWIRNGRLLVDSVSDGHVSDSYIWGNNNPDVGAVHLQNVADGWSFNNVDVVPGVGGGAAYWMSNTNNIIITGGYADGSYDTIMTGYGIRAVNSGRIFVSGWRAYNLGRSGIRLENTHGCQFLAVGFHRNNKAEAAYPDIDLYGSTGNRFVTSHIQNVDRVNRGGIYREDTASTKNGVLLTADTSLGNFYGTPLVSANAGTLDPRSKPESILPRNPAAADVIFPPASTYAMPAPAAWHGAGVVVAHRFQITVGAVYSRAHFRVDSGSGSMQVAVLKMSGSSWTRVLDSGVIACTTGDKTVTMNSAYLLPGEYALALWVDNTTATLRTASSTGLAATRSVAEWTDPAGIAASGTLTWAGFRHVGGLAVGNP